MEKKEQIYSNDRKDPGSDQTGNSLCQVTLKKRKSFGLKTLPQLCPLNRYSATSLQVLRPYFRAWFAHRKYVHGLSPNVRYANDDEEDETEISLEHYVSVVKCGPAS